MLPIIGVTAHSETNWNDNLALPPSATIHNSYLHAIIAAGGVPVTLPNGIKAVETESALNMIRRLDGLLLTGGPDVAANLYHKQPHPTMDEPDERRDNFEVAAIQAAVEAGLPILGVCRGMHMLNVFLHGTLIRDLISERPRSIVHKRNARIEDPMHSVQLYPSDLCTVLGGEERITTNTSHHQAIDQIGDSLIVVGVTRDDVVEAVMSRDGKIWGVQYHPQDLVHTNYHHADRLFAGFVDRCRR